MDICSIENCGLPVEARGWCNKHYRRWRRHGDPKAIVYREFEKRASVGEPLLYLRSMVLYNKEECLLWPYAKNKEGYGCINKEAAKICNSDYVHINICVLVHGPAPKDKPYALHRCGNGHLGCFSPVHVYWGTQSENILDAHKPKALA